MSAMKLYYSDTLAPRKVCAFARHIGAPVEFRYVTLEKGEHKMPAYLTLNPNGRVPTLTHGEKVLWEADAILCEIARATGSDFWPGDDQQVELIRWFSWNSQHFTRHGGNLYFEYLVRPRFGLGPLNPASVEESQGDFRRSAAILNDHLKGRKWLMGDRPTIADFSVGITLPYEETAHLPLEGFAEIRRWHDQLNDFPAWREPWPELPAQAVA